MSQQMESPTKQRRQQGRSPAYPTVDLGRCLERVEVLWKADKQFEIPIGSVVSRWGFTTLNGPAGLTIAALKKFGLVTDDGSKDDRRVKVSNLAVEILNHPDPAERAEALRRAALTPSIHREMWDEHGTDLPSADSLQWELVRNRGFTDSGAREFIKEYRSTVAYARLADLSREQQIDQVDFEDEVSDPEGESTLTNETGVMNINPNPQQIATAAAAPAPAGQFRIPLPGGKTVLLDGAFPLDEMEWSVFTAILQAMRPGLTTTPAASAAPADERE